jgi:hypothetical protein
VEAVKIINVLKYLLFLLITSYSGITETKKPIPSPMPVKQITMESIVKTNNIFLSIFGLKKWI